MRVVVVMVVFAAFARSAWSDHDHSRHDHAGGSPGPLSASLRAVLAAYESRLFRGDYQGIGGSVRWSRARYAAGGTVSFYALQKNGRRVFGAGDLVIDAEAVLLRSSTWAGGATLAVGLPVGDDIAGTGMGHVMVMPAAWCNWHVSRIASSVALGVGGASGGAGAHAQHRGAWPLVDPMNALETTFAGRAAYSLTSELRVGIRASVAIPVGTEGSNRLRGAIQVVWPTGRVETHVEIQRDFIGDTRALRGFIETSYRLN